MLALAATVLAVYGQTLGFAFIGFDDPGYVYHNPHVLAGLTPDGFRWAFTTFDRANWHPLTWLSLMLDAQLYGLHAGGYHLTNLLLHTLNTLLLFRWLRLATGALWSAATVAFFFAAHPLHVESVAWVTERKDVLSTAFFFLTLLAYTRHVKKLGTRNSERGTAEDEACNVQGPKSGAMDGSRLAFFRRSEFRVPRSAFLLALACFALGLLAKPMLVTLPPLLLLLDYWPLRRFEAGFGPAQRRQLGWLLVEKIPFGLLMVVSSAVTYVAQHAHAVVALNQLPLNFRLATAALGVGTYLQKTFWPGGMSVYYPYWYGVSIWWPIGWAAALALLTVAALWQWRRRPYVTVGWLWFLGMLVPVIGLVQVGTQAVADRYTYLPHVGLFIALCWVGQEVWRQWPRARVWLNTAASAAALGCLGTAAWQAHFWRDGVTLFAHSLAVLPAPSSRVYQLYANALAEAGRTAESAAVYEQAWRSNPNPNNHEAAEFVCRDWLGNGRSRDVVAMLEPLAREPDASADTLGLLAAALARERRVDEAAALYGRCTQRYPEEAFAHFALADLRRTHGDVPGACAEYEEGLARRGDNVPALKYLAWTYAHLDDPDAHGRALQLARRAVELGHRQDPGGLEALAAAEAATGQWPAAVEAARDALALTERNGAPPAAGEACRERLAAYQRGDLP